MTPFRTGASKAWGQTDKLRNDLEVVVGASLLVERSTTCLPADMWVLGALVCRWRRSDTYSWESHVLGVKVSTSGVR